MAMCKMDDTGRVLGPKVELGLVLGWNWIQQSSPNARLSVRSFHGAIRAKMWIGTVLYWSWRQFWAVLRCCSAFPSLLKLFISFLYDQSHFPLSFKKPSLPPHIILYLIVMKSKKSTDHFLRLKMIFPPIKLLAVVKNKRWLEARLTQLGSVSAPSATYISYFLLSNAIGERFPHF